MLARRFCVYNAGLKVDAARLECWLMLARRFCVYNAGLKVDTAREILTVIMTSNGKNVCLCKRHTVVCRAFCFWWLPCPFLASQLTTVSLNVVAGGLQYTGLCIQIRLYN